MKVSVIVPCRNECEHIESMLHSVLQQDYGIEKLEIVVVDGMSDDGTVEIVERITTAHPQVKLVPNPERTVPHALNSALRTVSGDIILRMDVHCRYPANYVSRLVQVLMTHGADNAGGVCDTRPGNESPMAGAIAAAMGSRFGVGNARFRTGASSILEVDTVPFGCYRREVFARIGLFDTDLIRNQDDEFNARLIRAGGRILLVPDVVVVYFARPSLYKLIVMLYEYGLFKPLSVKKAGGIVAWRQFVPLLFVMANIGGVLLGLAVPPLLWLVLALNGLHLGIGLSIGLKKAVTGSSLSMPLLLPIVFYAMHWAYGWGYATGAIRFIFLKKRPSAADVGLSR